MKSKKATRRERIIASTKKIEFIRPEVLTNVAYSKECAPNFLLPSYTSDNGISPFTRFRCRAVWAASAWLQRW
jgi:hypothetical protein